MKFKAEPNLYVRIANKYVQRATRKKGFFFDSEGFYETDNELLIKVLSQRFDVVPDAEPELEESKLCHCKKCDFVTDNKGILMQHYKTVHPKDKEGKDE